MIRFLFVSFVALSLFSPLAQANSRGDLITARLAQTYTADQLNKLRDQLGLGAVLPETKFGVQEIALTYSTVTETGAPTVASGMLLVPISLTHTAFPLLSEQHGTSAERTDAPSNPKYFETIISSLVYAAHGFVTSMPDYLGMGVSLQSHPYLHAQTEASAARDMLLASRAYAAQNKISLTKELYLTGYSQGGHATMALHRLLQSENVPVTASLPMAGPYDLSHTSMRGALNAPTVASTAYVGFFMITMNRIYHYLDHLGDAFVPSVASTIEALFDGTHSTGDVVNHLPGSPTLMLTAEYREAILASNQQNKLVQILEQNDVYDWTPKAPVYLFQASGDRDVPYGNSELVYKLFKSRGVQVELTDLGATLGHVAAAGNGFVLSYKTMAALHEKYVQGL